MDFMNQTCNDFITNLASKDPVPGGGGASALVGAIGTALGNMVGSLTVGKKKYAEVENDIIELKIKAEALQNEFSILVEKDAEAFKPLAASYGLPQNTEEEKNIKEKTMEAALKVACSIPLEIMKKSCESILLLEEFAEKGSKIAISDAGTGVLFCKAALLGASLNVFINTGSMNDKEFAKKTNKEAELMIEQYSLLADKIYNDVKRKIG